MPLMCNTRYVVGDRPTVRWEFLPDPLHPSSESTAFTVQVEAPDGTLVMTISSPNAALAHSVATRTLLIDDVPTVFTVSYWDFTLPTPFNIGSDRRPWKLLGTSTAGIQAARPTEAWVLRSSFPALA